MAKKKSSKRKPSKRRKKASSVTHAVRASYEALVYTANAGDYMGDAVSTRLLETVRVCLEFLSIHIRQPLKCDSPGKSYFSFIGTDRRSRPVNDYLFDCDLTDALAIQILNCDVQGIPDDTLSKSLYTLAMSYCAAADLVTAGDKKTPAQFFEIFCGHLVGRMLGVNPTNAIQVLSLDINESLPTDFIFDLGPGQNKIHMPVKTSTRERVIQVWAHQRVIDGIFGVGRFKGVLVCIAETNAKPNNGVTEVCLPGQWVIYQMFIAQLHRVYYLDMPDKYAELGSKYPFIHVKSFASFFKEATSFANSPPIS